MFHSLCTNVHVYQIYITYDKTLTKQPRFLFVISSGLHTIILNNYHDLFSGIISAYTFIKQSFTSKKGIMYVHKLVTPYNYPVLMA